MNKNIFVIIATIIATIVFSTIENLAAPASACQTNAKGCIKQGGPGASIIAPPEESGCHVLPPVGECAESTAPEPLGHFK